MPMELNFVTKKTVNVSVNLLSREPNVMLAKMDIMATFQIVLLVQ